VKKRVIKLVVAGPVNAGKTTLIRSLSDVPVVCTNEQATDEVLDVKELTTVAMDHGVSYPGPDIELHLYGTPGQRRFDFMWEILAVGADGILILVDGSHPESLSELGHIHDHFSRANEVPCLVGVSKRDVPGSVSLDEVATMLDVHRDEVVAIDPRDADASMAALMGLLNRP